MWYLTRVRRKQKITELTNRIIWIWAWGWSWQHQSEMFAKYHQWNEQLPSNGFQELETKWRLIVTSYFCGHSFHDGCLSSKNQGCWYLRRYLTLKTCQLFWLEQFIVYKSYPIQKKKCLNGVDQTSWLVGPCI